MVKSASNPGGTPIEVFDQLWKNVLAGRSCSSADHAVLRVQSSRGEGLRASARASIPAHRGRASSWPNALADRELLSWLCLQTRFRQILEGARIVDRLVAKLLQRFSGERRAPA
jgi:hypothetical protein